ncbi:MAG: hypothetical protein WBE80_02030 [Methylocella sp.]
MQNVLAVYTPPRDPSVAVGCLGEATKQLIKETREPALMKPGQPARLDYEYERRRNIGYIRCVKNGTANLVMMFALLGAGGM